MVPQNRLDGSGGQQATLGSGLQVKDVVRSGGTDFAGAAQALSTSYGYKSAIREADPATGVPWTKAGVNTAEFGMDVA
jgi:hypothetical protein